jgi:peptidoglycan/xylan/chitin deacetylase (PgdA/CDA1 family)
MKPGLSSKQLRGLTLCAILAAGQAAAQPASAPPAQAQCKGTIYLTFDTGSQSQAELIEQTLLRHHIKATFFLANEKTIRGDYSLDPGWQPLWKRLAGEGHAFGTHTFDHVYVVCDLPEGKIEVRPQFGAQAGSRQQWTPAQYCEEMTRVDKRFQELTGRKLDPLWRAPGGKLTTNLLKAGEACGYAHVAWAPAGFSGDELPSDKFPNDALLKKALNGLKDGDIFLAHMGIWSRKDPWAPAVLEPLVTGLQARGFCFRTLREHPDYAAWLARKP